MAILLLTVDAQAKKISYGPKAGGNLSLFKNLDKIQLQDPAPEGSVFDVLTTSFHYGAYCEYGLTPKLSIGTELVYARVGCVYKQFSTQKRQERPGLKLIYTCIPLWLMFYPAGTQKGWSFYLGPSLNFLWRASSTGSVALIIEEHHVAWYEWAVIVGLRYQFSWGLGIDLRYSWGLTDILDFQNPKERLVDIADIAFTNHYLQLSASYDLATLWELWRSSRSSMHPGYNPSPQNHRIMQ